MTWTTLTHDQAEYAKRKSAVDYWMLAMAAAEGGTSVHEVCKKLFSLGIGDAERDTPMALAYSSTGLIVRTAKTMLRKEGLLEPWETTPIGRIKLTAAGRAKLESLKGES